MLLKNQIVLRTLQLIPNLSAKSMADWSQLPKELLLLISEKLNSEIYLIRFRSVCSTWRFSIPKPHNHFPLKLPHCFDTNRNVDSFICKLSKHSLFLIKPPTTPNQQTLHHPWLIRISLTSTGKFSLFDPLLLQCHIPSSPHVLDFNQLSVFNIGHTFIHEIIFPNSSVVYPVNFDVSMCQGEQPLDIVTHKCPGELVILRFGDNSWMKIPNVAESIRDMCIFKGRPCVVDQTGRTVMIRSDFSVHLVAESVFGGAASGQISIMVENESELLLVHKYKDGYEYDNGSDDYFYDGLDDYAGDQRVRIDVFRLDKRAKKWMKLENLGDKVLFLGQVYSFTASASDLGFDNGNFVIYCNKDNGMSVFHFDQQMASLLSDYPDYLKLFWPRPEWIVSRCL